MTPTERQTQASNRLLPKATDSAYTQRSKDTPRGHVMYKFHAIRQCEILPVGNNVQTAKAGSWYPPQGLRFCHWCLHRNWQQKAPQCQSLLTAFCFLASMAAVRHNLQQATHLRGKHITSGTTWLRGKHLSGHTRIISFVQLTDLFTCSTRYMLLTKAFKAGEHHQETLCLPGSMHAWAQSKPHYC